MRRLHEQRARPRERHDALAVDPAQHRVVVEVAHPCLDTDRSTVEIACRPPRTRARSASASSAAGSATRPACRACWRRRSTSPACKLTGRRCLVVGGGEIGLEKVEGLLACDGRVVLVAPDAVPELRGARRRGLDRVDPRASTSPATSSARSSRSPRRTTPTRTSASTRTPSAARCSSTSSTSRRCATSSCPAIVRTGPLAIAISTAGASPALAKRIKRQIAEEFGAGVRAPRRDAQRGPRLGEGHAADLPGPQGVLRGHRQRRARPDRAAARRRRGRRAATSSPRRSAPTRPPRRDRPRRRPPGRRAPGGRRAPHAGRHVAHARRAHGRHGGAQAREPAAGRRLQVPRRLQHGRPARRSAPRGVVTASSGNHAQALALSAALHDLPATILMPEDAPASKAAATEGYGARIVRFDRYADDREALIAELAERDGLAIVHPYDDERIMAGQGTATLELIEDGGAAGPAARARRRRRPDRRRGHRGDRAVPRLPRGRRRAGVRRRHRPLARRRRARRASRSAARSPTASSSTSPGARTFPVVQARVAAIVTVSDAEIVAAMRFAFERLKLVLEPSGASALAALLHGSVEAAGARCGRHPVGRQRRRRALPRADRLTATLSACAPRSSPSPPPSPTA